MCTSVCIFAHTHVVFLANVHLYPVICFLVSPGKYWRSRAALHSWLPSHGASWQFTYTAYIVSMLNVYMLKWFCTRSHGVQRGIILQMSVRLNSVGCFLYTGVQAWGFFCYGDSLWSHMELLSDYVSSEQANDSQFCLEHCLLFYKAPWNDSFSITMNV